MLDQLVTFFAYIIACLMMFFIGAKSYALIHRDINLSDELVEKDNLAFSFSITGYYIGLILAIGAAFYGPSHGFVEDITDLLVYGFLSIILLNLSILINDKIILRKFDIRKEIIVDQNSGSGLVEMASSVATGLVIFGAVSGENGGIETALIIWFVAQLVLVLTSLIYNLITPYDIHEHIEKDNVAVGLGFAGALIAIANIIRFSVSGDFSSWEEMSIQFVEALILGLLFLPLMRFLTDKVLLPGQNLTDEIINQEKANVGAALIEAFSYIGSSVLITWCL